MSTKMKQWIQLRGNTGPNDGWNGLVNSDILKHESWLKKWVNEYYN